MDRIETKPQGLSIRGLQIRIRMAQPVRDHVSAKFDQLLG